MPGRLPGSCSEYSLKSCALEEIEGRAKDHNLRTGLKLHCGRSVVDVADTKHLAQLRRVFRVANRCRMQW